MPNLRANRRLITRRRITVASSFTPASLANLKAWYKADAGVFQDAAGTVPGANNQPVGYWTDQSGNGLHLTNATDTTNYPTYKTATLNGLAVIDCDNTSFSQFLYNAAFNMGGTTASAFVVVKFTSDGPNSRILSYATSGGSDTDSDHWTMFQPSMTRSETYQTAVKSGVTITSSSWNNLGTIFDGTNNTMYKAGVADTPVSCTTSMNATGYFGIAGAPPAGGSILKAGQFAELVVTSGVMTPTEISNLTTYFTTRWGV